MRIGGPLRAQRGYLAVATYRWQLDRPIALISGRRGLSGVRCVRSRGHDTSFGTVRPSVEVSDTARQANGGRPGGWRPAHVYWRAAVRPVRLRSFTRFIAAR
jgi:hypothetical protein